MALPGVTVEAAFGVSPNDVPGALDWVDLSGRASSLTTNTGRSDKWSQPSAGSLDLELNNSDGELDPDNSAGAWYGDIKPRTWVRVTGGPPGGAEVDVFTGKVSIEGWRVEHRPPGDSVVRVTVLDALEDLANTRLPGSVYEIEVREDSPKSWHRLGESSGTTAVDSSDSGYHGTYEGGATFGSTSGLVANDENGAITFDGVDDIAVLPPASGIAAGDTSYTIEAWISHPEVDANDRVIWEQQSAGGYAVTFALAGTSAPDAGALFFQQNTGPTTGDVTVSSTRIDDGNPHHVVAVNTGAITQIWVDGVLSITGPAFAAMNAPESVRIGYGNAYNSVATIFGSGMFAGTIDEVAVYDSALDATRIAAHYAAGTGGWEGDTTAERAARILDLASVPTGQRTVETTTSTTMPAATLNTDALSALQAAATAEGGLLYVDHHDGGKLRFRTRADRWTDTRSKTSQATLGDSVGEVPYERMPTFEAQRIINSVEVQRFGGSTFLVEDATSIAAYQPRSHSETGLLVETDSEVLSRANWIVNTNKDERRAPRQVTLAPRASTHPAWDVVFALELGDRITVKYQPHYGGTHSYDSTVEGISHRWDQAEQAWSTTLSLSPGLDGGDGGGVFIIGESLVSGADVLGY